MGILDPKFRYVSAKRMGPDYLKKRFARIRRGLKQEPAVQTNVMPIRPAAK